MATFEQDLLDQSLKLIRRHEYYARQLREDDVRRIRRTGGPASATIMRPDYWASDPAFDPYRVRDRASRIGDSVRHQMRSGSYMPFNPVSFQVPKTDGTLRPISVFPLVETTVATRLFKTLMSKNSVRMSARSYGYRTDRSPHDAVQHLSQSFASGKRLYVAEFDFSRYFETIEHDALWELADRHGVLWTRFEQQLIERFLQTELQTASSYVPHSPPASSGRGLPQGNSISLFLANLAAMDMDMAIERTGVGYTRYADDTVLWSESYANLVDAAEALRSTGAKMGAVINKKKSPGIRLFTHGPHERAEIDATESIDFIGYRFSRGLTAIRPSTERRIKKKLAEIVWRNLLSDTDPFRTRPSRLSTPVDRDYVTMIFQLRRYIYGGMSEARLHRLLRGRALRIKFPGVMSYFPLVSDTKQLQSIDGWLIHNIEQSLKLRATRMAAREISVGVHPYGLHRADLLHLQSTTSGGHPLDLTVPSFTRIGSAILRAASAHGAVAVARSAKGAHYLYGLGD